ncbi:hypothetical protein OGAPHI_003150 [Ogataea philodendri]|uniref:Uncharacterized protein n=1 Tax=Ogataea philodendri TaxID=1378263 RepID=A0A9P8T671_9ASCO|nr:uncharacterized protein OGAPHI_003150 [Ogataea philodendri]KAH3667501.1 hypothetical protein OGAPHI_003150 [Ogataea philodendri]
MQVSIVLPSYDQWPTAPAYTPRFCCSSSPISSIARTLGAPETVPAGKIDRNASKRVLSPRSTPLTCDTRCITCENRSTVSRRSTFVESGAQTLLTSFLAKSTSITCSARSLSDDWSVCASSSSSSLVLPRRIVPAIGCVTMRSFKSLFTSSSGEAPTIWKSRLKVFDAVIRHISDSTPAKLRDTRELCLLGRRAVLHSDKLYFHLCTTTEFTSPASLIDLESRSITFIGNACASTHSLSVFVCDLTNSNTVLTSSEELKLCTTRDPSASLIWTLASPAPWSSGSGVAPAAAAGAVSSTTGSGFGSPGTGDPSR